MRFHLELGGFECTTVSGQVVLRTLLASLSTGHPRHRAARPLRADPLSSSAAVVPNADIPILLDGAPGESDKVLGFERADDYLTKPFGVHELRRALALIRMARRGAWRQADASFMRTASRSIRHDAASSAMAAKSTSRPRSSRSTWPRPDVVFTRAEIIEARSGRPMCLLMIEAATPR